MKAIQSRSAALLMAALLLGGCATGGGSSGTTSSPAPASASGAAGATTSAATITIKDFGYSASITVAPGTAVTVTNMDSAAHTVTADQGQAFDARVAGSGGTATFTAPSTPGTYPFHCTYHPNMHGTLTVK
ncbi:cupredoxin domain-containing protein [Pseudarthrobacter sulfonivorans]|uniref:cupredoxin domain-containing protein n=1 Tax=Pseudarthrobacter sulfonivorans TaxID=121292 RepID=UPI0021027ABE|nr:cupredoxin domain-containing protein [Pseudarthrobacter sulfonivorans]